MNLVCILPIVFALSHLKEDTVHYAVECVLIEKGPVFSDVSDRYRHLKIDCTEGLAKLHGVTDYNKPVRWSQSDDCYRRLED